MMILALCIASLLAAVDTDEAPVEPRIIPFFVFDPTPEAWGPSAGALDRKTGAVLWKRTFPSKHQDSLYLFRSPGIVMTGIDDRTLCLDAASGRTRLDLEGGLAPVSVAGRTIYLTPWTSDAPARARDEKGTPLWSRPESRQCILVADPSRPCAVLTLEDARVAVDPLTGLERWRRPRAANERTESVGGRLLTCSLLKRHLREVDLESGRDARILELPESIQQIHRLGALFLVHTRDAVSLIRLTDLTVAWTWTAPEPVFDVIGGRPSLLVRLRHGNHVLLDPQSGREIRRLAIREEVQWPTAFSPRGVLGYEPRGTEGMTTVFQASTGAAIWEGRGACLTADAAGLFLIRSDRELKGIEFPSGRERWSVTLPEPAFTVEAQKDRIFLLGTRWAIALDAASGRERWRTEVARKAIYMGFAQESDWRH